jgi:hypothetical protein
MDEIIEEVNKADGDEGTLVSFLLEKNETPTIEKHDPIVLHVLYLLLIAAQTRYEGGDDYLRAKFEEYILTLLSSVKHSQFAPSDETTEGIGNSTGKEHWEHVSVSVYGRSWLRESANQTCDTS